MPPVVVAMLLRLLVCLNRLHNPIYLPYSIENANNMLAVFGEVLQKPDLSLSLDDHITISLD